MTELRNPRLVQTELRQLRRMFHCGWNVGVTSASGLRPPTETETDTDPSLPPAGSEDFRCWRAHGFSRRKPAVRSWLCPLLMTEDCHGVIPRQPFGLNFAKRFHRPSQACDRLREQGGRGCSNLHAFLRMSPARHVQPFKRDFGIALNMDACGLWRAHFAELFQCDA